MEEACVLKEGDTWSLTADKILMWYEWYQLRDIWRKSLVSFLWQGSESNELNLKKHNIRRFNKQDDLNKLSKFCR